MPQFPVQPGRGHMSAGGPVPPCTPFYILCQPIQTFNDVIQVGSNFTDVTIAPVTSIGNALVILDAGSCWTAPQYAIELVVTGTIAANDLAIEGTDEEIQVNDGSITGTDVAGTIIATLKELTFSSTLSASNPLEIPLSNGAANGTAIPITGNVGQSSGAWFEWIDEETIRVWRSAPESETCGDCADNCVGFSLQVIEFCPDVVKPLPT